MRITYTHQEAYDLFTAGQAIYHGPHYLVTRTAEYQWDDGMQFYLLVPNVPLRVSHRLGARWRTDRFVPCHCQMCTSAQMQDRAKVVDPT
jgi:hypothetical protein